jgi:hypothetical protein
VRVATALTVLASAALLGPAAAAAATSTTPAPTPSPARIAKAVARAEASSGLWATINICNSRRDPDSLGVRGQMPALGFAATLAMTFQVDYFDTLTQAFVPITGSTAVNHVSLGTVSAGLSQGGAVFPFNPGAGELDATVTFTWTVAGKVVGTVTRTTSGGHPTAKFASPPHYSEASCTIP